jgi:hypothetical protein
MEDEMAKVPTQKELDAVAEVIRATGFTTLADEFLMRPADRERIVRMMTNILRRDGKTKEAGRFNQLATWVMCGLWVSA